MWHCFALWFCVAQVPCSYSLKWFGVCIACVPVWIECTVFSLLSRIVYTLKRCAFLNHDSHKTEMICSYMNSVLFLSHNVSKWYFSLLALVMAYQFDDLNMILLLLILLSLSSGKHIYKWFICSIYYHWNNFIYSILFYSTYVYIEVVLCMIIHYMM